MAKKIKEVDKSKRPPLKCHSAFKADKFLMYLIQDITKLSTSDILGFFADLSKEIAEEGVHYMYEQGTRSMIKKISDFFPGTSIPYHIEISGSNYAHKGESNVPVREASYIVNVCFPTEMHPVDQVKLSDIIMEKAILGGSDLPEFAKPDTKCPKMYRDLMKEVQSRLMV